MKTSNSTSIAGLLTVCVIGITAVFVFNWVWESSPSQFSEPGAKILTRAYAEKLSGFMVEVDGEVVRTLMYDPDDPGQQKFVMQLTTGQALLVSHQFKPNERIPLAVGDTVVVRGTYDWSETGGKLRWTNRDDRPGGEDGWVEHMGERYH